MSVPYLGNFAEDATVYIMFNTFTSDDPSASATITNFINTDVHIHKNDDLTPRNNAAGITVSVDFDGITGSHMIKIDTNDDTVAGFWVTAKDYFVRIEGTTVDGAAINAVVGHFSIENRYNPVTDFDPPTRAELTTDKNSIITEINANETKIDTVDGVVDGIQTDLSNVTDGLGALKALIDALNDLSAAQVNAEADQALVDYDPPTRAELTADKDSIITEVDANETKIDALNDISAAEVNAEVVDALNVDTYAEPGQEAPGTTVSLVKKIGYLYKAWRNKWDNDGSVRNLYNDDAATVDQKSTVAEAGGTVTVGEMESGP